MARGGVAARAGRGRAKLSTQQRLTGTSSFDRLRAGTHKRMGREEWTELKSQIIAERGARCEKCGRTECDLVLDHIMPHSKGGSNSRRNLQLLCEYCDKNKIGQANRRGAKLLHGAK